MNEIYEIGSEFQSNATKMLAMSHQCRLENNTDHMHYLLSGRTALQHVVDDIRAHHRLKCVALPAYCCGSMIAPFYDAKEIEITFYSSQSVQDKAIQKADVVLIMDYFGYYSASTVEFVMACKDQSKTTIFDATQMAFSATEAKEWSDYVIVSYRKWADILVATAYCKAGFLINACTKHHSQYNSLWRMAADIKAEYLKSGSGAKKAYLSLYASANALLDRDYKGYSAEADELKKFDAIDIPLLIAKRRENAEYLTTAVMRYSEKWRKFSKSVELMFPMLSYRDCPLFVPILVDAVKRDEIRKQLIEADIYCPAHWPIDVRYPYHETDSHKREISLVCDQRYGIDDMEREIKALSKAVLD